MEVIRFDGYTTDEKVAIARRHLWPRQIERNGLRAEEVTTNDTVMGAMFDTLGWRRLRGSVELSADRIALAAARSGTRSKNNPALPRMTRSWSEDGDHATPTRGETLFVSVEMGSRNCRS